MEQNRSLAIEDALEVAPNEALLRLLVTDLLLGGLGDIRVGQLTLEQSHVLKKIEAALEAYGSYFYPPEHR